MAMGPHGPIGEWDVSRVVTDMNHMFWGASLFNAARFLEVGRVEGTEDVWYILGSDIIQCRHLEVECVRRAKYE